MLGHKLKTHRFKQKKMKKKTVLLGTGLILFVTVISYCKAFADTEGTGDKTYDTETCKLRPDANGNQHTGSWCNPPAVNGPCATQSECR